MYSTCTSVWTNALTIQNAYDYLHSTVTTPFCLNGIDTGSYPNREVASTISNTVPQGGQNSYVDFDGTYSPLYTTYTQLQSDTLFSWSLTGYTEQYVPAQDPCSLPQNADLPQCVAVQVSIAQASTNSPFTKTAGFIVLMIILILLFLAAIFFFCWRKRKQGAGVKADSPRLKYSQVPDSSSGEYVPPSQSAINAPGPSSAAQNPNNAVAPAVAPPPPSSAPPAASHTPQPESVDMSSQ